MEANAETSDNQPNRSQNNLVSPVGLGQLVYTNPMKIYTKTDSQIPENQKDKVNEMKNINESNEENYKDSDMSKNHIETINEKDIEKLDEGESDVNKMETKKNTQNQSDPHQGLSQGNIQFYPECENPNLNLLEDQLVDEKQLAISPRQAKGLAVMLMSKSIVDASRTSGIPERTLRRWLTDPNFKLAFTEEVERIKQAYLLETLSLLGPSLQARRDLLENPTQPGAAIKEKVADKTIKSCEKSLEMLNTEERIERLERLVRHHDQN